MNLSLGGKGGFASGSELKLHRLLYMKDRYVYFIQEAIGLHAPIKIGVSNNVKERLRNIQCCNPRKLEVYATLGPMGVAKAFQVEEALHKKFKSFHLRGEWFSGVIKDRFHTLAEVDRIDYI